MKTTLSSLLILFSIVVIAQKKVLDHPDFEIWNTIQNRTISNDGDYIMYALEKGETDNHLKIKTPKANLIFDYQRGENGAFTYNSEFAIFTIKAWQNEVKELKRKKVKKDKLPKDTLGIYNLKKKSLTKIANVKSYKIPEKGSSHIAYLLEEIKAVKKEKDTSKQDVKKDNKKTKAKKVGKDNGYHLVLRNLNNSKQDTLKFVTNYNFSEDSKKLAFTTTGKDNETDGGVYVIDLETNVLTPIYTIKKAKYYQLNFSETGKNLGFIVDADTTKTQIRPNELYVWKAGTAKAEKLVDANSAPDGYRVSSDGRLSFSKDDSKLYFGLATPPIVKDTTLLEEEIVNVEVWTYDEPTLYTVQELQVENEKKRSYLTAIHLNNNNKLVQIGTKKYPNASLANEGNAINALVNSSLPYEKERQWKGALRRDYAIINTNTGAVTEALKGVRGQIGISPMGKYAFGYNAIDSTWVTYNVATAKTSKLTKGKVFYNETNDLPNYPGAYGLAGWTDNDEALIIYDRYDIWSFNPETGASSRLTKGRETKTQYRYVELDNEARFLDSKGEWLLMSFNEKTKHSGYAKLNRKNERFNEVLSGPYRYGRPQKAKNGKGVLFTRETFVEFPNIHYTTDLSFKNETIISDANPQQKDYNWGTSELVNWTSLDGLELTGMLIKPENFDPNKKYPMIVNFYDRSSDRVYSHRAPSPGRSTINYSFYTSRGYLIFNPDVYYRTGYPGESAYNCVISGTTALIEKGFVDKDNIGVQGHSWGGYQIAYLVTKTDIFKAAEAGAPVPNMISAYGGIRWWTGLSRQFQYEHTQSRIGGTPWEYPTRYIENSPIFSIDKINTPLLIMHNDADGHVPWYQGIEFFMSLRRLQKPAWFLNYNGEPHWPLKYQNRKDFNIRMAQFFDYHLKGAGMPAWMKRGVPAIEKGVNQGYELQLSDKN
ncbi:S9 family peptidase [Flavobacteriaceae bacterium AU392]|nr:S9 family peptidase [Flavobacteriaceae bacterium]RKM84601.1 S9 family peptidase [Flavobacteriaceae bacterium AU392]